MPTPTKNKVFVSYSRHDEALVRPLAGLLGVAAEDAVFLDVEQIKPGELWEKKIIGAVQESTVFVICWCCQSDKSEFVAKEIATALTDENRRLVPVLFCSSSLPASLNGRQWIDLRGQVVHNCPIPHSHEEDVSRSPEAARPASAVLAMASPPQSMGPDPPVAASPEWLSAAAPPPPSVLSKPQMATSRKKRAVYVVLGFVLLLAALVPIGLVKSTRSPVPDIQVGVLNPGESPKHEERPHVAPAPAEKEAPSSPKAPSYGPLGIATLLIVTPALISIWILFRQRASRVARWRETKAASGISTLKSYAQPMGKPGYRQGFRGVSAPKADGAFYNAGVAARRQQMLQRRRVAGEDSDADVIARRAKSYFENLRS